MNRRGTGLGSASLILIFSVLCLTVFALLTLYTANREKSLTEKIKTSVESYYSADSAAVEVTEQLRNDLKNGGNPSEINNVAISKDGGGIYSYCCAIDDRRSISVELKNGDKGIEILSWNETNIENWTPEEKLNIWMGD